MLTNLLISYNCNKHTNSSTDIGHQNVPPRTRAALKTTSTKQTNTNNDEQEMDKILEETIVVDAQGNVVGE